MSATLQASTVPLAERYDLALVDLDGVVYRGADAIPHAVESLTAARQEADLHLLFVTNNASREPESVAEQLSGLGIATLPADVMTAAQAGAALLGTRLEPGARVLVVGGAGLVTAVRNAGYIIVDSADDAPAAVIQGYSPQIDWTRLAEAAYAVEGGAWHVASNKDLSIPTARGIAPGNGALVAAVEVATGRIAESAGKPSPRMYELAVERVGARSPLVIGDRLDTDLAGAREGGIDGLHVLTGVSTVRDAALAPASLRPHYLGIDLRALLEVHPVPERDAARWWNCRLAAARVVKGHLELAPGPITIDTARAVCTAVWDAVDKGESLDPATVPELVPVVS